MSKNKHLLGIIGTKMYNIDSQKDHYQIVEVSDDVLDWLKMHDFRVDSEGNTVFKVNNVEYIYLGKDYMGVLNKLSYDGE